MRCKWLTLASPQPQSKPHLHSFSPQAACKIVQACCFNTGVVTNIDLCHTADYAACKPFSKPLQAAYPAQSECAQTQPQNLLVHAAHAKTARIAAGCFQCFK